MPMAVIICTERHFEHNSLLLIKSLRVFGGTAASTLPVFSYSPRSSYVPTDQCLHAMAKLGVHVVLNVHNPWPNYGLANKVVACAHAEQALPFETLVFLDSDQIVLQPLDNIQLGSGIDVAVRPVDRKNVGFANKNDVNYAYWKHLYTISGTWPKRKVETTLGRELIWEYYNSGLISVRRNSGILSHWLFVMQRVFQTGLFPKSFPQHPVFFVEQSSFAAAVTAKAKVRSILPVGYNYPITPENEWRLSPDSVSEAITLHYHKAFEAGRWQKLLDHRDKEHLPLSENVLSWLRSNLKDCGFP
jgi:hypothetical protein